MHIIVTDVLTCPRCGPDFGLIVLADRIEDRRVRQGSLGCANCREAFAIRDSVADLRFSAPGEPAEETVASPPPADEERAFRIAALLGITEGPGLILVVGAAGPLPAAVARIVPGVEVLALTFGEENHPSGGEAGVSRLISGRRFPLRNGSVLGAALVDAPNPHVLGECVRILRPDGRLVVERGEPETAAQLGELGAQVLLQQDGVVVASRSHAR